nr:MAG TPA: hypothetical protein [Caudoviricetes sp.]DAP21152.1 MAG TPA: hypothetical protein [Caudoviricetes sp.]
MFYLNLIGFNVCLSSLCFNIHKAVLLAFSYHCKYKVMYFELTNSRIS